MKLLASKLIFLALVILSLGFITQAQAQNQVTSYNRTEMNGGVCTPCQGDWYDNKTDVFNDTYNLSTGLHSGNINFYRETKTCGCGTMGQYCDYQETREVISAFIIYDTSNNVILSRVVNGTGNDLSWTNIPGGAIGRIAITTAYSFTAYVNDGTGGCYQTGGGSTNEYPNVPFGQDCPLVNSFTATPQNIVQGQSVTLAWSTSYTTGVTISGLGSFGPSGSVVVTPSSNTTYTLTANAVGNCPPATAQVTVNVTACPQVSGSTFSASPSSIVAGQNTTLSWNVPNATSVVIQFVGTFGASGSIEVSPNTTTTFNLTANGAAGCPQIALQATVTVCPSVAGSTFTATPASILAGQNSTLTWNVPHATSVNIPGVGTFGASGSVVVTPSSNTTYTLTASGGAGCSDISLQTTVTVTSCPTVAGSSFAASPSSIVQGQSSTLSWNIPNAVSVTISGVPGTFGSTGSVAVSPSATTAYTLTATGAGACGSIQLQATVTVTACPQVAGSTFTATPSSILAGESTTLSWNVPNATNVVIQFVGTFGPSGSVVVTPSQTTTLTLTANGADGCAPVTLQTTVTVCPTAAGSSFSASPSSILVGQSSTLSWNVPHANSVTIPGVGTFGAVGSVAVSPSSTTTYTLTASGGGSCSNITMQATVNVSACPTVAGSTFTASPSSILAGQSTTLSWNVPNATSVVIQFIGTFGASGSIQVSPNTTTTFNLTANGAAGCPQITLQTTVTVTDCPQVAGSSFTATPSSVLAGQSTTLTWNVPNATQVVIQYVGTFGPSGSVVVTPSQSTTLLLTAYGASGCPEITLQTNVTVCPTAAASSFAASPTSIVPGGSSTLTWYVPNATNVTISGVPGTFGSSGSVTVSPAFTTTYTLTAAGGGSCSSIQMQATVTVTSCPTVGGSSFVASPSTIALGGSSTLSWNVPNAASVTISGVSGTFGATGSVAVSPSATTVYTLTATGSGSCASIQLQATVTVSPCPQVSGSTFSASPTTILLGGSSTLSWNIPNAVSVTISGVDGTFGAVGSVAVSPTSTTTYTLIATGAGACRSIQLQATVNVTPCPVVTGSTFIATPTSIIAGQSSTLSWNIPNATGVTISGVVGKFNATDSVVVTPSATTTYILTATGAGACAPIQLQVTVTVTACPTVGGSSFTASPSTINQFESSTLSWNVPNAVSVTISGVPGTFASTGSTTVAPSATTTYTLTGNGAAGCSPISLQATVTVGIVSGAVLIGPRTQPAAVGPTSNNDDYTNKTLSLGVDAPAGGFTSTSGTIDFINTVRNNASVADTIQITIQSMAPGVSSALISVDGGNKFFPTRNVSLAALAERDIIVRVVLDSGIPVLTGYNVVVRATSLTLGGSTNDTIDRSWTGFVRVLKSQIVTNTTGVGASDAAVSGAIIEYILTYSNMSTSSGFGNVDLTATNLLLTESGSATPNNWASTTTHVEGSASDSLGGTITGDRFHSSLLTDRISSLAPGVTGIFRYKRQIK